VAAAAFAKCLRASRVSVAERSTPVEAVSLKLVTTMKLTTVLLKVKQLQSHCELADECPLSHLVGSLIPEIRKAPVPVKLEARALLTE
jgi:hypothetical protein